jgi:hypothetical protein
MAATAAEDEAGTRTKAEFCGYYHVEAPTMDSVALADGNAQLAKMGLADQMEMAVEGGKNVVKFKGQHAAELLEVHDEQERRVVEFRQSNFYKWGRAEAARAEAKCFEDEVVRPGREEPAQAAPAPEAPPLLSDGVFRCEHWPADVIPHGQHRGKSVDAIWAEDPQYVWFLSQRGLTNVQLLRYQAFFEACPGAVQRAREVTEGLNSRVVNFSCAGSLLRLPLCFFGRKSQEQMNVLGY